MTRTRGVLLTLALTSSLLWWAGCTTTGTPSATDATLAEQQQRISQLETELAQTRMERDRYASEVRAFERRTADLTQDLTRARTHNTDLQTRLDVAQDGFSRAKAEMQAMVDRAQEQARNLQVRNSDIESTTDAEGKVHLSMPAEVLFQPGSEVIGSRGKKALDEVVRILNEDFHGNRVEIAGHADSDPIRKTRNRYDSNMDLSLARAHAVWAYLMGRSLQNPERVHAAGYGEYQPRVDNLNDAAKQKNRRVEVVVFPD